MPSLISAKTRVVCAFFASALIISPLALAQGDAQVPPSRDAEAGLAHAQSIEDRALVFEELRNRASSGSTVRVIVGLDTPFGRDAELTPAQAEQQRRALANAQRAVVTSLEAPTDVTRFSLVPYMALEVGLADLERLQASPLVVSVMEDIPVPPMERTVVLPSTVAPSAPLEESVPLIGADAAWAQGFSGEGWSVAVLDTGVDGSHPFLAGKVVAEGCFSTTSGSQSTTLCPSGQNTQIGTGAGASCDASIPGCDHGTHVAGIAAGSGSSFSGVARDASVIAVQVFSEFPAGSQYCSGPGPCVLSYTSDQVEGLEYVYSLRTTLDVAAANMSLGGGRYTSTCDAAVAPTKAAIDQLLGAGIATAIASGNDGFDDATGAPGCISTAVTVGSTTKVDGLSFFSNTAPWVDLMAPGSSIRSSVPGGGFEYFNGTSMATPHVAGAIAILRQAYPAEPIDDLLDRLTSTGVPILAGNPPQNYPRIQVDDALGSVSGAPVISVTPSSLEEELPAGSSGTQTLTLQNEGTADLTFDIGFVSGATTTLLEPSGRLTQAPAVRRAPAAISPARQAPQRSVLSPARIGAQQVSDGSFEEGSPNPYWAETSINFGTPLCDQSLCGSSFPHSGSWWAWFGGTASDEVASLSQDVTIPTGTAELGFFLQIAADTPGFLEVRIDNDVVFYADQNDATAYAGYTPVTLDVSAYADGESHTLVFYYESSAGAITNFFVDDVTLSTEPSGPSWLTVTPTAGTVVPEGSASVTLTYDATGLEAGEYTTTIAIASNDANSPVVEVPITLTVSAVNQPPQAANDEAQTNENEPVTVDVLANDTDPDGDLLTVVDVSTASNGGVVDNGDGSITYTPEPAFSGDDLFTYTISDGNATDQATVTVTVRAVHPDSLALVALYESTDGPSWADATNWLTGPMDTWHGISTDAEGRVSQIELNENGLNGTIPTEISALTSLTELRLAVNDLTGEIPAALTQLTELRVVQLNTNELSGELPEGIGALQSLEQLSLFLNDLSGAIPAEIGQLAQLTSLGLGENAFTGTIPAEIGQLANLVALDVNGNQLEGALPEAMGDLASLESLVINDNPLTGPIPLTFTGLTALDTFNFAGTELCVPDDPAFQAWLEAVANVTGTSVACFTNQPPVAADDVATTDEDVAVTIDVLANDEDPDGDALTVTEVSAPEHGTAEADSEGAIVYTPDPDFAGTDTFAYTVSDGHGGESTATVTATIEPVNDAPTAATVTTPADGATIELTGNPETVIEVAWTAATDAEGDAVSYRWEAVLEGGDFDAPLLSVETDGTAFETTYGDLDVVIAEAGVGAGEDAVIGHRVVASDGEAETPGQVATVTLTRGILTDAESGPLPISFAAAGVYPNPSAGAPRIAVDLPWSAEVTVEVYDAVGRKVATWKGQFAAGDNRDISLDGLTLPTGVYVYRVTAVAPTGSEVATGRFTVVR